MFLNLAIATFLLHKVQQDDLEFFCDLESPFHDFISKFASLRNIFVTYGSIFELLLCIIGIPPVDSLSHRLSFGRRQSVVTVEKCWLLRQKYATSLIREIIQTQLNFQMNFPF